MRPFVMDGDVVTVVPVSCSSLKRGDIAFYRCSGHELRAHRVLALRRGRDGVQILARGDAASGQLEEIPSASLLGKVVAIRRGNRTLSPHTLWSRGLGYGWAHWQSIQAHVRIRLGRLRRRMFGNSG